MRSLPRRMAIVPGMAGIVAVMLTAACGSEMARQARVPMSAAESIDPFAYGDEFALTAPGNPAAPASRTADAGADTTGSAPGSEAPVMPGIRSAAVPDGVVYRIQLGGVFEDREEADAYARRARNRLDGAVSVEYRAPFYRVYAGDFATQRDAEAYIQVLRQQGFNESRWVPERPTAQ